jgi:hypothetical protein
MIQALFVIAIAVAVCLGMFQGARDFWHYLSKEMRDETLSAMKIGCFGPAMVQEDPYSRR